MNKTVELLGDKAEYLLSHTCKTIDKSTLHLPSPHTVEEVWVASDRNIPTLNSLQRLLGHGRLGGTGYVSILPVDQGIEHTAGASFAPNPIYFDPENIVRLAIEGVNEFYSSGLTRGDLQQLMLMLSPFAPHMVEEMWENMGFAAKYGRMAMQMEWPAHDESKTVDSHVEMAVQVNGKLKGTVTVPMDSAESAVVAAAMENEKVKKSVEGMNVVKTILVKNKLVNLIVKPAK